MLQMLIAMSFADCMNKMLLCAACTMTTNAGLNQMLALIYAPNELDQTLALIYALTQLMWTLRLNFRFWSDAEYCPSCPALK